MPLLDRCSCSCRWWDRTRERCAEESGLGSCKLHITKTHAAQTRVCVFRALSLGASICQRFEGVKLSFDCRRRGRQRLRANRVKQLRMASEVAIGRVRYDTGAAGGFAESDRTWPTLARKRNPRFKQGAMQVTVAVRGPRGWQVWQWGHALMWTLSILSDTLWTPYTTVRADPTS